MAERTPLNLNVSPLSHEGWATFCHAHGTTMTALAEAIGLSMGRLDQPEDKLPRWVRDLLADSRRIAAHRLGRAARRATPPT
jgi:hypothetical protein